MTTALVPGGNVSFAQVGLNGEIVITLVWVPEPGADMDLSALLCTADGKVRSDDDLVFYNQPLGAGGAVRHVGKDLRTGVAVDRLSVHPARLPADVEKVVIAASIDGGGTFGSLSGLAVEVAGSAEAPPAVRCDVSAGAETALVFAEVYRRAGEWKVRAVGQGYSDGLADLATEYGVSVDEPQPAPQTSPSVTEPAVSSSPSGPTITLRRSVWWTSRRDSAPRRPRCSPSSRPRE